MTEREELPEWAHPDWTVDCGAPEGVARRTVQVQGIDHERRTIVAGQQDVELAVERAADLRATVEAIDAALLHPRIDASWEERAIDDLCDWRGTDDGPKVRTVTSLHLVGRSAADEIGIDHIDSVIAAAELLLTRQVEASLNGIDTDTAREIVREHVPEIRSHLLVEGAVFDWVRSASRVAVRAGHADAVIGAALARVQSS